MPLHGAFSADQRKRYGDWPDREEGTAGRLHTLPHFRLGQALARERSRISTPPISRAKRSVVTSSSTIATAARARPPAGDRRLGVSHAICTRLENAYQNVTLKTLTRLCHALDCDMGALYRGGVSPASYSAKRESVVARFAKCQNRR